MGLWDRVRRGKAPGGGSVDDGFRTTLLNVPDCPRGEWISVVGESHCQTAIRHAVRVPSGAVDVRCRALLRREPTNSHDANAIQVYLRCEETASDWVECGYIARSLAAELAPELDRLEAQNMLVCCSAKAIGAGPTAPHDKVGVVLYMSDNPADWT